MSQEIWINLPVKDVERSTAFFNEIGFHAVSVGNERAKLGSAVKTRKTYAKTISGRIIPEIPTLRKFGYYFYILRGRNEFSELKW